MAMIIEKCTELSPKRRFKSIASVRGMLFAVLVQPTPIWPSAEAKEWVASLENVSSWDIQRLHDFAKYLQRHEEIGDNWTICQELDEEKLTILQTIDNEYWEPVALVYCGWAANASLGFEYCDVVVRRLELIFKIGSIECKAAAALAAAKLGVSHNRWFVMRVLLAMCSPSLNDAVAKRIAIEIAVEEVQYNFVASAAMIGRKLTSFHPTIVDVLQQAGPYKDFPDIT